MYGFHNLKQNITVAHDTVECPVIACQETVKRQRKFFRRQPQFQCPVHKIFISSTTFEYEHVIDNLLWKEEGDLALLEQIMKVKRESRMTRSNSEDALSWNVFRYLEKTDQLVEYLTHVSGRQIKNARIIYWSFSQEEGASWSQLIRANREFGERPKRGSEPDLIVISDDALFFIEAKLTASNKTSPSRPDVAESYQAGGDHWYSRVLKQDFLTVAFQKSKYELLRFWLLGTWLADQLGLPFYLLNLVLAERECDIELIVATCMKANEKRCFQRITWEQIYHFINDGSPRSAHKQIMLNYFQNMTIGYDTNGRLRKAFSI